MLPETISVNEAAKRWLCSPGRIRKAVKAGELKAYQTGKAVLIDVNEGDSWFRRSGEKLIKKPTSRRRKEW